MLADRSCRRREGTGILEVNMNQSIASSSMEKVMREGDLIVSMTDLKGVITYGNRVFIEVSGYSEEELLGSPHSIVRHPDMPRAMYKLLWDKIQNREECFIYLKDRGRDGSYCWVFANITPTFDPSGNVTGYFSVRRKPKASGVQAMSGIYQAMLDAEKRDPANAIAASSKVLADKLKEKGLSYEEFVLAI